MLDLNYIRENPEEVKKFTSQKKMDAGLVDQLLEADRKHRQLIVEVETLRAEKNKLTKDDIEKGKELKQKLKDVEPQLKVAHEQVVELQMQVPNVVHPEAPVGESEDDNKVHREVGKKPEFGFTPKDHLQIGKDLDLIDFEAGAKVSGSQFYYLKNEAVLLEFALVQYALEMLMKEGFVPMITPDLALSRYYLGTGYLPRGDEAQTYEISDMDLGLIATAEVTLTGYHADEVFPENELPKKYVGYSHCYRREAGAYGKFSKGLYRVHQFSKVEMYAFCRPDEADKMHAHFLEMEEKLWQGLGIPYRVLEMCSADLGAMAVRKFDLEAWMPGKGDSGDWGEVTSTSNTTDYQARRLNIKYRRNSDQQLKYVYTLNGTALAVSSRAILAILENYQQVDGSVAVPEVLRKWVGKEVIGGRDHK